MTNELDYQILLHINRTMEEDDLLKIEEVLANNLDEYMRFREIHDIAKPPAGSSAKSIDALKQSWRNYARLSNSRFDMLIRTYFERYKENAKKEKRKCTVTELNRELSGHNKWYRMLKDHGIGLKYHDDMRKLCFIFRLTYSESVEFLWSAGQTLDSDSRRDFVIAECLVNQIYEPDKVNERLAALHQPLLFYV